MTGERDIDETFLGSQKEEEGLEKELVGGGYSSSYALCWGGYSWDEVVGAHGWVSVRVSPPHAKVSRGSFVHCPVNQIQDL
jgi:hypothetical protein